jgi:hypothetical protein
LEDYARNKLCQKDPDERPSLEQIKEFFFTSIIGPLFKESFSEEKVVEILKDIIEKNSKVLEKNSARDIHFETKNFVEVDVKELNDWIQFDKTMKK